MCDERLRLSLLDMCVFWVNAQRWTRADALSVSGSWMVELFVVCFVMLDVSLV